MFSHKNQSMEQRKPAGCFNSFMVLLVTLGSLVLPKVTTATTSDDSGELIEALSGPIDRPQMILGGAGDADLITLDGERALVASSSTSKNHQFWERRINFHLFRHLAPEGAIGYYDPTMADPNSTYCYVYAPALSLENETVSVTFSAFRAPAGGHCPERTVEVISNFQMFRVSFSVQALNELYYSSGAEDGMPLSALLNVRPTSFQGGGLGRDGLGIMKLDPFVFQGSLLFSSINLRDKSLGTENIERVENTNDALNKTPMKSALLVNGANFKRIAEGPSVFTGPNLTYLLFQANQWYTDYTVYYKQAKTFGAIQNSTGVKPLMPPVQMQKCRKDTCYFRNYGINRVFTYQNKYYIFYHVLDQTIDHGGRYIRDGWIAPLVINNQGSLVMPERLDLRLPTNKKLVYEMDLILTNGERIMTCLNNKALTEKKKNILFGGVCSDGRYFGVETVAQVILRTSVDKGKSFTSKEIPVNFWNEFYDLN